MKHGGSHVCWARSSTYFWSALPQITYKCVQYSGSYQLPAICYGFMLITFLVLSPTKLILFLYSVIASYHKLYYLRGVLFGYFSFQSVILCLTCILQKTVLALAQERFAVPEIPSANLICLLHRLYQSCIMALQQFQPFPCCSLIQYVHESPFGDKPWLDN